MTAFISRILVGVIGLPVVLGAVWVGGWWLFGLVAGAAAIAVHEFVTMARPLRPLAPAVYIGVLLALTGAHNGGVVWMVGGALATFVLAFVLNRVRQDARAVDGGNRGDGSRRDVDRPRPGTHPAAPRAARQGAPPGLRPC